MKKTQLTDATRNIRKRIVSYLSICLVIMLGVGVFLATRYMEAGIAHEAAGYYADTRLKDFEIYSSLGATDADIRAAAEIPGVTAAEGAMEFDAFITGDSYKGSAKLLSLTHSVSVPVLREGVFPSAGDECAIGEDFAEISGISVGDDVTIYLKGTGSSEVLKTHKFKVTGLVSHPDYVHRKMTNTVVVPLASFDMSVMKDAYTKILFKTDDLSAEETFSPAYFEKTAEVRSTLKDYTDELSGIREKAVKDAAYAEIDRQWEEAEAELEAANAEIEAGQSELDSKLASGRRQLNAAEKKLESELAKYKKMLANGQMTIDEYEKQIKAAKKQIAQARALLDSDNQSQNDFLDMLEDIYDDLKVISDPRYSAAMDQDPYLSSERRIAEKVVDNEADLRAFADYAASPEGKEYAREIDKDYDAGMTELFELAASLDMDQLVKESSAILASEEPPYEHYSPDMIEKAKKLTELYDKLRGKRKEAQAALDDAEKQIAAAEKTLAAKKAELNAGKRQLKNKEADARAEISAGWAKYRSEKHKYESKLAEARALLAENREAAEAKLEEARQEVEKIDCSCILLDRNANAGYLDVTAQLDSMHSAGLVFGILFILITALVCFSTLTIIIEEQKKLIGTVKAFGFHKFEVLSKYLLFAVSAGIIGSILAIITGVILSKVVLIVYSSSKLYQYGLASTVVKPVPTVLISAVMILVCAVASIIACSGILRSPASMLMKGQTVRSGSRKRRTSSSGKGSLYSKLILRNILDDKARVIVSTAIVAFCCMLIGIGISFKLAFTGMVDNQQDDVNRFDLRMDMGDTVTDKQRAELIAILDSNGADHTEAVYKSLLFDTGSTVTGLNVIAGDPDTLADYYGVKLDGKAVSIPSDGVLVPVRMSEIYGYQPGDSISVLDSEIHRHEAAVTGTYTCYFGRNIVTSPEGYRKIFGDYEPRSFYIRTDSDIDALKNALLSVSEDVSFESSADFRASLDSVSQLYNIIVYVTTGIAILMSFMILTNLANIFLNRKKTELTVMRINGFSIRQTKGYLARESVLTTVIGLAAGVLAGSLLSPVFIRILEPADLQFDRTYQLAAWIAAVGLEGLFALIIYSSTFRRIRSLNLRDLG